MDHTEEIKRIQLIYFSGTGGTKRIAEAFEKELRGRGLDVMVRNLGIPIQEKENAPEEQQNRTADLTIILYPVYALDAPQPIYDWIERSVSSKEGGKAAVISVSGGGETWPNTGCRNGCCKALEEKGFRIVYDRMLCMPANVLVEMNDHAAMWLIKVIPQRTAEIIDDLLAGRVRRTHFKKGFIRNWISETERKNSGKFARGFEITDDCTSCGWCVRNCPKINIEIPESESKPRFSDRCVICTRCIYGCPARAIKTKGPLALKKGFDLEALEKRMDGITLDPVRKCCKGLIFKGLKDYLLGKY